MLLVIFFVICFGASIVGAICGIGGGVIIKPVLDAFQILDVATISFLSGCTVLSMSTYAVLKSKVNGKSQLEPKPGFHLHSVLLRGESWGNGCLGLFLL